MERLNLHLAEALASWGKLTVIGPMGCSAHLPDSTSVTEVPVRPLWRFLLASLRAARREAKLRSFDLAIAGSGLTAPAALLAARRAGGKSAAYVHGLDLLAAHPVYRALWQPVLRRLDRAVANSKNTADIARRLGVARGRIDVVYPGVTLPDANAVDDNDFRARHGLGTRPMLLSVGRLTARKGLAEFIRHSLPIIVHQHPEVLLVVIGDEASDALIGGASGGRATLSAMAADLGLTDNLLLLGPCDDAELSRAYFAADVHVFPVREVPGDVEGFGMVAIEAAAHGLPTVAFAVGGVPDAVAQKRSGWLIAPGNYAAFADRVNDLLASGRQNPSRVQARGFAAAFEWRHFGDKVCAALGRALAPPEVLKHARHGHAVLDLKSRDAKARKIEKLLSLEARPQPIRLLEVGTGSGGIAHYFGTHPHLCCEVDAVDVSDTRQIRDGYQFNLVDDVDLPFPDGHFDVVLSNHVIEHVGDSNAQRRHLAELRRVLKSEGVGYLAVPNRWQWVEPHYRVAGLSWLPEGWRSPYLRWRRRGEVYDCRPLTTTQAESLLNEAGFAAEQQHGRALRLTYELEHPNTLAYRALFKWLPDGIYGLLRRVFPTLIYVLKPM